MGNEKDIIGNIGNLGIPLNRHGNQLSVTRLDLFHIGNNLVTEGIIGNEKKTRRGIVYQGNGTMLNLGGTVAFSMNIGNLLELEGPLHSHRIVQPATEKEKIIVDMIFLRQSLDLVSLIKNPLNMIRELFQRLNNPQTVLNRKMPHTGQTESENIENRQLGSEGLRGGHGYFRTGMQIDTAVRFPGNGRTDNVAETEHPTALALDVSPD